MADYWHLPPLILHPFSGGRNVDELLEGSKAAMALRDLSDSPPADFGEQDKLERIPTL